MSKNILGQTFGTVSLDLTTSDITADKLIGTSEIIYFRFSGAPYLLILIHLIFFGINILTLIKYKLI